MNRFELEHALRAAQEVTGETVFIVLGSQSILGQHPDAPRSLRVSLEVDIYPRDKPDLSLELEGSLGAGSLFHQTHGFCVDGCGPETSKNASGWQDRLVEVCNKNTGFSKGLCLHPMDAAYAKLYAGRQKDLEFVEILFKEKLLKPSSIQKLLESESDKVVREKIQKNLEIVRSR